MKLWGGRFKSGVNELVNTFNASISIDSRMYTKKNGKRSYPYR